jgi:hypothetical protein
MVVLLTYGLRPRKKPVSHLTSAARLACSTTVLRSLAKRERLTLSLEDLASAITNNSRPTSYPSGPLVFVLNATDCFPSPKRYLASATKTSATPESGPLIP